MNQEIWVGIIFALGIISAGFVQRVMGFGYAVVALGVLPYVLEIRTANLAVSFSLIAPLLWMLWLYRRDLRGLPLKECLFGAAAGLPIGLAAFAYLHPDWLVRGTGLAILLIALDGLLRRPRGAARPRASRTWGAMSGVISGFLSGSVGVGGPPVAAYAARQRWTPRQFKSFIVTFSVILASLKAVGVAATGFVTPQIILLTLAAIPFGYAGATIGAVVARRIDAQLFRKLTFLLLAISASSLLVRGKPASGPTEQLASGRVVWQADDCAAAGPTIEKTQ